MGIQVTELTQGKDPWKKEFVDFEFDGKNISEFGLVVAFGGDRLALPAFPEFEDETSDVNGATGQLYWGTRFKTLKRSFNLVTDGMTEEQLRDFRVHFSPGKYGKFVEPHLLGRCSYCRVGEVQNFEVVPFRKDITFLGHTFTTNEYKGEINITLCWDEPIFYAENDYIDLSKSTEVQQDIRKVYVNSLPTQTSFSNLYLGKDKAKIYAGYIGGGRWSQALTAVTPISMTQFPYYNPSTYSKEPNITIQFDLSQSDLIKEVTNGAKYYCIVGDSVNGYALGEINISSQAMRPLKEEPNDKKEYDNFIDTKNLIWNNAFKFTSPNVVFSINKAIELAYNYKGAALGDFEIMLQTELSHEKVLTWAIQGLAAIDNSSGGLINNWQITFNNHMLDFFDTTKPLTILFDGEKMETIVTYTGRNTEGNFEDQEEKSGNVACSPYLKLVGGDGLDDDGRIKSCHFMKIEGVLGISSILLNYKYCYI